MRSPDDQTSASRFLLCTPRCNCAIQDSFFWPFTPTLRERRKKYKLGIAKNLGYGRKSLGPKLGPGSISSPRENLILSIHHVLLKNLKVLKYDQRVLQTQNESQRDIALKSTPVIQMNRVPRHSMMIGYFTSKKQEARAPLGECGRACGVQRACMS